MKFAFEDSGKIKRPSGEELAEADNELDIITYTTFTTGDGRPYYAFLAVKPSRYKEFSDKTAAMQPMVLSEYGTIIADGYESEPPPAVIDDIRQRYGFLDKDYEQKLMAEAKKQQKVFVEEKEEKRIGNIVSMLRKPATPSA